MWSVCGVCGLCGGINICGAINICDSGGINNTSTRARKASKCASNKQLTCIACNTAYLLHKPSNASANLHQCMHAETWLFFSPKAEQSLPLTRINQPQIRPFLPGDSPFPTVSSKSPIAYSGMSQECVIVCTLVTACVIGFAICTHMCVWLTLAFLQQAVCFTKLLACSCRK